MKTGGRRVRWRRTIVGCVWLIGWAVLLGVAHRPWHELGGLISERMRWLERLVLGAGFVVGCFVGSWVRDSGRRVTGRPYAAWLCYVWVSPAALAATGMIVMSPIDWRWTLLILVALLSYSAGLDSTVGAWPLVTGRPYHFLRRISADDPAHDLTRRTGHRGLR
jgi:hypothetical protein